MITPLLFSSHGPGGDRITLSAEKSNDNAKQMPTGCRFAEHVEYGTLATSLGALNKGLAETDLFHLFRQNPMARNVIHSVRWPDKFINQHTEILALDGYCAGHLEKTRTARAAVQATLWESLTDNPLRIAPKYPLPSFSLDNFGPHGQF